MITVFPRSLAQHWDDKLVAVIVSAYDVDGAVALSDIEAVDSMTIAQKLDSAMK